MSNLELALDDLRRNLLEMVDLVNHQLSNCKEAIHKNDEDLAEEVISMDKRVNAMELKIDKDCESILALYNPVATDLRFVMAALKTNHDLERIGDNIRGMAKAFRGVRDTKASGFYSIFQISDMFDIVVSILDNVRDAMESDDTKLVRKIFKKDAKLDKLDEKSLLIAAKLLKANPTKSTTILSLYTIAKKLERIGDLSTNLGEEMIFHIEAKVLKHKKKLKKDFSKK
ncbi:MAG: phosphate signaling complex protein PhoU [Bacteroidetes bacterium]|nr:phosphate signaling complex protein PhoU [Bacteroidota bacterium]MDA1122527.1 phosphate signaling complex protein PhoU [Bacteroidota bacterium]